MGIDIGLVLPFEQFLDEGSGLVISALYGLLEGLDDVQFFVFGFGFLGKDDGIGDVRQIVGRKGRIFGGGDVFGIFVGHESGHKTDSFINALHVDIQIFVVVNVNCTRCVIIF